MAVAALIVAVLALVAAAFSAWYARDVARTERDRRLEERAPKITPQLRQLPDPGSPWVLELLLDHETPSGPLAEVSATIPRFTDAHGDTYPAGDTVLAASARAISVQAPPSPRESAGGRRALVAGSSRLVFRGLVMVWPQDHHGGATGTGGP